jgi:hypothetical protein
MYNNHYGSYNNKNNKSTVAVVTKEMRHDNKNVITEKIIILLLLNYDISDKITVSDKKLLELLLLQSNNFPQGILIEKFVEYMVFKKKSLKIIFNAFDFYDLKQDEFIIEVTKEDNIYDNYDDKMTEIKEKIYSKDSLMKKMLYSVVSNNIEKKQTDNIDGIIRIIENLKDKNVVFISVDDNNYNIVMKEIDYFKEKLRKQQNYKKHAGQPLVDREKGRAHLDWKYCAYSGCGNCYNSTSKLVEHLEATKTFKRGYHYYHEKIVEEMELTEDLIMELNMSKCPSVLCEEQINGPAQLIFHLKSLGIKPFWKKGELMDMKPLNFEYTESPKIYETDDVCHVCLDSPPNVLYYDCGHLSMCMKCHEKYDFASSRCILCKKNNKIVFPYKKMCSNEDIKVDT